MLNSRFFRELDRLDSTPNLTRFLLAFIIFFLFIAGSFAVVVKQKVNTEQLASTVLELSVLTKDFIADANIQDIASKNQSVKSFDEALLKLKTLPNIQPKDIEGIDNLWKNMIKNTETLSKLQQQNSTLTTQDSIKTIKTSIKNDSDSLITALKQMIQHDHMPNEVIMIALVSWLCCGVSFFGYIRVKNRTQATLTSSVERC
jgi:hypothetical protein